MRRLLILIACITLTTIPAQAKVATPGVAEGGNLPLADVLDLAKPYPNLILQVRLQLVRANLKRDQVACAASRFGAQWTNLGGARLAPYQCAIGKRTLAITANQIYFDRNGRKVSAGDPELMKKAAKVKENGLAWRWK
jgi:hypothetical protein